MDKIFSENGILARAVKGYRPRAGQIAMARAVAEHSGKQILEAGTGIGKTFAYLAPILCNGLSAVISTGTRALQDQLYLRDLPFLIKTLQTPARVAMLKGRANYLCRRNLADPQQSQLFRGGGGDWARVLEYAKNTEEGDIRGATDIAADSPIWTAAVSARETCPAQGCEHYEKCFLYRARARAKAADIVIVNHYLFLADMRLREEEVAELLPARDLVVFDEAHLLPSLAPQYFGESLSATDIFRILAEIDRRGARYALPGGFVALAKRWRAETGALSELSEQFPHALAAVEALKNKEWAAAAARVQKAAAAVCDAAIEKAGGEDTETGEWFAAAAVRAGTAAQKLEKWRTRAENGEPESDSEDEIFSACWIEKSERGGVAFHTAPVSGREVFRRAWDSAPNVVMTSATLTINGAFESFAEETGMAGARAESWASPFDYAGRSMLYLPPGMPPPNEAGYTAAVIRALLPLIRANEGRAFILFSSIRALREGAAQLTKFLEGECEVFTQGDAPNDALLSMFRETPRAVLAGSLSFWQGVDVKGGALSLVAADKIPFSPPNAPLLAARDAWRKKRGEDPFMQNQIPPAAILMKQVAGRLMRDFDDWGVFAACDPRLTSRGYGKIILNSLPPMRQVRDEKTARDFLQKMRKENGGGGD